MSVASATLPGWRPELPRLSASLVASLAIHGALLVLLTAVLRAMPAPSRGSDTPIMQATLLTQQVQIDPATLVPLDVLAPAEPLQKMLPIPLPPPSAAAPPLPGISVVPAKVQTDVEFASVGNIASGISNGVKMFGDRLSDQMRARFPEPVAQGPQLAGPLVAMYPAAGAREGRSMTLSALLMIDESGQITEARVLPDDPVFVPAVIAALRNASFKPAKRDGRSVPYWTVLDFRFTIAGPTAPNGKRLDR
jgi:TonB family protein